MNGVLSDERYYEVSVTVKPSSEGKGFEATGKVLGEPITVTEFSYVRGRAVSHVLTELAMKFERGNVK